MRVLLFITLVCLLVVPSFDGSGSSHGLEGYSESGCTCHGDNAGSGTSVEIVGIPENFTHGEKYECTIILTGGPLEAEQGHRGGFNLKASNGDFLAKDSDTYVTGKGEITHDHSGANQRSWVVKWTAPFSEEDVQFTIAGNVVDGDHQPSDGDDWALASYTSYGSDLKVSDRISHYTGAILAILLFAIPLVLLIRRKK